MLTTLLLAVALTGTCDSPAKVHLREGMAAVAEQARLAADEALWRQEAELKLDLLEADVALSLRLNAEQKATLQRLIADARKAIRSM